MAATAASEEGDGADSATGGGGGGATAATRDVKTTTRVTGHGLAASKFHKLADK